MEQKGLRVNMGNTKVMKCKVRQAETLENFRVEYAGMVLEETRYVVKNARSIFTKKGSGIRTRLELVVGFQCTDCTQGAVVRSASQELWPIQVNSDT